MSTEIRTFNLEIPQADLDELHRRIDDTRWAPALPGQGFDRGVPVAYLQELARYWRTEYDWRAHEARLNEFPQYVTEIDGLDVHFLHIRSQNPDALPLILNHGWPNSFLEFVELIGPLMQNFHVVIPSVPGFGFSTPPRETGWTATRVATMWAQLMDRLEYRRYGVEGGDFGAYVASALAALVPDRVVGVYIISGLGFPTEADVAELTDDERGAYEALASADWMKGVNHHALLGTAPQTFAYGWNDSPVAALAWMIQKFHEFSAAGPLDQAIDRDLLLTNVSLYWFTETFGTSAWPYYDATGFDWPTGSAVVPTGVYSGPPGIRRLAERHARIVHWPEDNPGGHHFVAMDQPGPFAADLHAFFAKIP